MTPADNSRVTIPANNSRVTTSPNNIDLELTEDELDHVVGGNNAKAKPPEFVTFKLSTYSGGTGSSS
jgi:bacteriocin-like protein